MQQQLAIRWVQQAAARSKGSLAHWSHIHKRRSGLWTEVEWSVINIDSPPKSRMWNFSREANLRRSVDFGSARLDADLRSRPKLCAEIWVILILYSTQNFGHGASFVRRAQSGSWSSDADFWPRPIIRSENWQFGSSGIRRISIERHFQSFERHFRKKYFFSFSYIFDVSGPILKYYIYTYVFFIFFRIFSDFFLKSYRGSVYFNW